MRRFDTPISVDTWRASVAKGAYELGAVIGNDISGFGDPDYLPVAAAARRDRRRHAHPAAATRCRSRAHLRRRRHRRGRVPRRARRASTRRRRGRRPHRARRRPRPRQDVAAVARVAAPARTTLADLGYPLLLSASNKTFLGKLLDLEIGDRRDASNAATALGVIGGCRIVRVHDVAGSRRICDFLAALHEAEQPRDAHARISSRATIRSWSRRA